MTKRQTTDDTLVELWKIKDETAQRFQTAAEYFQYLGMDKTPRKSVHSEQPIKPDLRRSRAAAARTG